MGLVRLFWNFITGKPPGMANPDDIDIIATDRKRSKLLLVMTEHRPWNGDPMRGQFHNKANTYVRYVLSEQFAKDYPDYRADDVIVKLDCAHAPDEATLAFFDTVKEGLAEHGIGFEYEIC
jgi:hypothetical protein